MFTVCPKCALTLVVTTPDLRVAQGYVRCGRCSNVFNALNALSDERQAASGAAEHQEIPEAEAPLPLPEPQPEPPPAALEFDPVATNVEDVFVAPELDNDEATGTFEAIVLESGEPDLADAQESAAPDPDAELEHELQSLAERIEAQSHRPPGQDRSTDAAGTLEALQADFAGVMDIDDELLDGKKIWMWRGGIAALILALAIQGVHHYRNDLAVSPQLRGVLTGIYGALGVSLEPRWDVAAYEVHQLGATSDPASSDRLIVRASIKNAAPRPQPLPLLRVAVQDRFGNRIAARDVAPAAYVPRTMSPRAALAIGQRVDIEMRFVDPGDEAVGFEIDACLAAPGGGVNCANR